MSFTKEAYAKLNQNKDGIRFIRPFSEYTLQEVIDALTEFEKLKELYNKQSELLGLYQTLYENNNEHDYDLAPDLVDEMQKRIDTLEEELEEMK